MEDKYPIKEIKVMDGVYIWKPLQKSEEKIQNNNTNKLPDNNNNLTGQKTFIGENNYLCHGKDELVKIYEIEFDELGNKILSLFQSNEDMLEFDPHDYDLIQAREENLQLIDKKMEEMFKIQKKMKEICEYHPLVNIDIFDYFGIGNSKKNDNDNENKNKNQKNTEDLKEDKKVENSKNDIKDETKKLEVNRQNQNENENDIITEMEV